MPKERFYTCNYCGKPHRRGSKWERDCLQDEKDYYEIEDEILKSHYKDSTLNFSEEELAYADWLEEYLDDPDNRRHYLGSDSV